jgi:predicted nucleotidyltransferase
MESVEEGSQLLATLEEFLCRNTDIEFAVAFGSQATGNSRPSSDVDLAVKFAALVNH